MLLLLLLEAAEEQVKQALGGRLVWREAKGNRHQEGNGNGHHAAAHALKGQLRTQRLPHPTPKPYRSRSLPGAVHISAGW